MSGRTPESSQSLHRVVPRSDQDYITEVSKEIEGRLRKKLSKEFSWTESRILVGLYKLDDFFLNPQVQAHSRFVPATTRNPNRENHEPNEDRSQNDPCPEVDTSINRSRQSMNSDPDEAYCNCILCKIPF